MNSVFKDSWLPEYAEREAKPNCIEPMQQLYTKEGAARGNATVHRIVSVRITNDIVVPNFEVVTDANHWMILTYNELIEMFTPGKYILLQFPNPLAYRDLKHAHPEKRGNLSPDTIQDILDRSGL